MPGKSVDLMQSYYLYSAALALKLLAFIPLAALAWDPEKIHRDLKTLTTFWVVAALYVTTSPDHSTALNLFRGYALARLVVALGYLYTLPKCMKEVAFYVSFGITSFMGGWVVYTYRNAL
ncbi:microsomal glutathione S-transferase 1-like [Maniola jurtina]|uniref:microsomal glutathione S-transferase 1-like n=1 Tax=Maniola jurtina TaxID=191418 RepID=UPI001E688719|nr:microsomal glutathione S-transferase 1-like [Maniola jurtina]